MENRQINFFKSKDFNTVLKPFKKGTVVKIDSFDSRENQNELKIGLFGWYAIGIFFVGCVNMKIFLSWAKKRVKAHGAGGDEETGEGGA